MKLIILALCTVIAGATTFVYRHFTHSSSICLLPQGYTGDVYIIYDQKNGSTEEYEGNSRVYRIPANGVLLTRFSPENYTSDQQYFYLSPTGNKKKLPAISSGDFNGPTSYIKNPHEPSRNSIAIIDGGGVWSVLSQTMHFEYQHAFAGTYTQFSTYKGFCLAAIDSIRKNIDPQAAAVTNR
jgi:hypothetical protein